MRGSQGAIYGLSGTHGEKLVVSMILWDLITKHEFYDLNGSQINVMNVCAHCLVKAKIDVLHRLIFPLVPILPKHMEDGGISNV